MRHIIGRTHPNKVVLCVVQAFFLDPSIFQKLYNLDLKIFEASSNPTRHCVQNLAMFPLACDHVQDVL